MLKLTAREEFHDNDCSQLLRNHSYRLNLRAEYSGVREIRDLARIYSVQIMLGMKEGRS